MCNRQHLRNCFIPYTYIVSTVIFFVGVIEWIIIHTGEATDKNNVKIKLILDATMNIVSAVALFVSFCVYQYRDSFKGTPRIFIIIFLLAVITKLGLVITYFINVNDYDDNDVIRLILIMETCLLFITVPTVGIPGCWMMCSDDEDIRFKIKNPSIQHQLIHDI